MLQSVGPGAAELSDEPLGVPLLIRGPGDDSGPGGAGWLGGIGGRMAQGCGCTEMAAAPRSVGPGAAWCLWCLPSWRACGWRCLHCRQGPPSEAEVRLCDRPLVVVGDVGADAGRPPVLAAWTALPFITVGDLVGCVADTVVDHPPASMTFRIGTRIFMHPEEPSRRSRTLLWTLDPGLERLVMTVRAVVPGGDGAPIPVKLRPGVCHYGVHRDAVVRYDR